MTGKVANFLNRIKPNSELVVNHVRNFASITNSSSAAASAATKNPSASAKNKIGEKSEFVFKREDKYGAHNYHPLPVAIERAFGNRKNIKLSIN